MPQSNIYVEPKNITDIKDCYFYHTMDVPGHGTVHGEWDLRDGAKDYLGGVDFKGKRVLEMGTASGFLCFYMESQGADVIAYDLSEDQSWDIVPFSQYDHSQFASSRKDLIRRLNNAFWLSHKACGSKAKKVHGTVYTVPEQIGPVDITTFGAILVHVRDPFFALQNALRFTKETVIITESLPIRFTFARFFGKLTKPHMLFLPDFKTVSPTESWWCIPPETIKKFIGVLGFEKTEIKYHYQRYKSRKQKMYTIIGHRTKDIQKAF